MLPVIPVLAGSGVANEDGGGFLEVPPLSIAEAERVFGGIAGRITAGALFLPLLFFIVDILLG